MKRVPLLVHHSSRRNESRKFVASTRSPSEAVVSEMAPRWMTASSLRPLSHRISSSGGMTSAKRRLARLRHLFPAPTVSLTTMSASPLSLSAATRLEPMNPAPPVTRIMQTPQVEAFLPHGTQACNQGPLWALDATASRIVELPRSGDKVTIPSILTGGTLRSEAYRPQGPDRKSVV